MNFPRQKLSWRAKNIAWRKSVLNWADDKNLFTYSPVRRSVLAKKRNYDLINGKLDMREVASMVDPDNVAGIEHLEKINHYPIINSKIRLLLGEEIARVFDYRAVITNPTAISRGESQKQAEIFQQVIALLQNEGLSEQEFNTELEKIAEYFSWEWQDIREVRANALLKHYTTELGLKDIFSTGFMDALTVGEEIYQCSIVGGEPTIKRINPLKIRIFRSGYSNRVEDADVIILEDYWAPGKIIDTFYDDLTDKDIKYIDSIEAASSSSYSDSMDNIDETHTAKTALFMQSDIADSSDEYFPFALIGNDIVNNSSLPYDLAGNIRVLQVYWKSFRKIKKVKQYNIETGEIEYNFYPENYIIDEVAGEEEEIFWITEAWQGTKIGENIFVNMRPCVVQYNRLSNPSMCHFGIIGSIYNLNDSAPFSMVDIMKPYSYLYDIIHDRLNRLIAKNWGKIIQLDLAKVPKGWDISKWLYYAKTMGIAVIDSFKEGNVGAATGKIVGGLNTASNGYIDADWGNNIQQYINLLEYIKNEMGEIAGISKQREGQVSNRETVGGVERATLQSSHITEWLFAIHNDVKRRTLECLLETAKKAILGGSKKFRYILPDNSVQSIIIDGDEFAEADYGIVVDASENTQKMQSTLETLAQAALQTGKLSFSTLMKIYSTSSLAEKQRMIELDEKKIQQQQEEQAQRALQIQNDEAKMANDMKMMELQLRDKMNERDNETQLEIAHIKTATQENIAINSDETKKSIKEEEHNNQTTNNKK